MPYKTERRMCLTAMTHSEGEYVVGQVTMNDIEGYLATLRRGIAGNHMHISHRRFLKYLGEFEYLRNMRQVSHLMLDRLLTSFARSWGDS